jgi:hypothetical protein
MPDVFPITVEGATEDTMILLLEPRFAKKLAQILSADLDLRCPIILVLMEALLDPLDSVRDKQMVLVDGPSSLVLATHRLFWPTAPNIAPTDTSLLMLMVHTLPLMEIMPTALAQFADANSLLPLALLANRPCAP